MAVRVRAVLQTDKADKAFAKAQKIAPRAMAAVLKKGGRHIIRRVQSGPKPAPKRTGRLRREYEMKISHRGLRVLVFNRRTPYAGFVEFGTRKMRAQPHFRPAVKSARALVRREANKVLKAEFAKL